MSLTVNSFDNEGLNSESRINSEGLDSEALPVMALSVKP